LPIALIYLISSIETVGDLTANCMIARQPISGPSYISRLKGGVLGDGVSCMIAATFSAFPNTTFAQNNGVIQLTGVASRYVGLYIGVVLFCLGLFPLIGAVLQQIPKPVLGRRDPGDVRQRGRRRRAHSRPGAAGPPQHADHRHLVRRRPGHRRATWFAALDANLVQNLFDSAITSGGLTAIALCLLLPEAKVTATAANHAQESDTLEPL
jgi:xanthine permease XanP